MFGKIGNKARLPGWGPYPRAVPGGRLYLSGAAVSAETSAGASLTYAPIVSDTVELLCGRQWREFKIPVSPDLGWGLNLGTLSSATCYDVFAAPGTHRNSLKLEIGSAWSSATSRGSGAAAVSTVDGIYVKTADPTRRLLGTIYTSSTTTTEDTSTQRFVGNLYNALPRPLKKVMAGTWAYGVAAWRQCNATAAYKVEWVTCVEQFAVDFFMSGYAAPAAAFGVGIDSTTAASGVWNETSAGAMTGRYNGYPGIGYHYAACLEYGGAGASTNAGTTADPNRVTNGITGVVWG